jgi:hypothetical protein
MAHTRPAEAPTQNNLPEIPVFDVGPDFAIETARLVGRERTYAMLDAALAGVPLYALRTSHPISRSSINLRVSARDQARTFSISTTNGGAPPRRSQPWRAPARGFCVRSTGR